MHGSKRVMAMAIVGLLGAGAASGQFLKKKQKTPVTAAPVTLMADDVFKNVQVLKGIPVNQFMETMSFFSASLARHAEKRVRRSRPLA